MAMEGDLVGSNQSKVEIREIFDWIQEKASSILEFSLMWEEIDEQYTSMRDLLKERAVEVGLKEKSVMERNVELEKKEERLREVEERERKTGLLEKSVTVRLEEKEKENGMKQYLELSVIRLVLEKKEEEVMDELEERAKKVELLSKSKSCELERTGKEFELKQNVWIARKSKEDEFVEKSLKQLEAREKELSLLDETIKDKWTEVEKKEEIFEAKQKAQAEEMEMKSKLLELKEKKLEEREKQLELKQRELEERSKQAKTWADSHTRPAKRHKPLIREHMHDDEDKETNSACVVSASASPSVEISEANEGETEIFVSRYGIDEDRDPVTCAISEFNDFNKTMSSFVVGKVWALYDSVECMPRLYGQIKRVLESQLSLQVTWLKPKDEQTVPVACGRFKYGTTETISRLAFSHEMHPSIHGKKFIDVNPRKGETWALFRDWSKSWNNNLEQNKLKRTYRYDFVEVLLNFDENLGVGVCYLGKVKGFISVFKHTELVSFMIPPEEMHRFSHRVPSVRLNGEEKEGIPAGSFELDPAAIPIPEFFTNP